MELFLDKKWWETKLGTILSNLHTNRGIMMVGIGSRERSFAKEVFFGNISNYIINI